MTNQTPQYLHGTSPEEQQRLALMNDLLNAESLREMALRGGGILVDDDHELLPLSPEPPGLTNLWNAYMKAFARGALAPIIGRKLVALLHEAGLKPVRNTMIFFGGCAGEPRLRTAVDNLVGVLRGARERILETGIVSAAEFEKAGLGLDSW